MAIGFLIGLQREFSYLTTNRPIFAGERTFALLGLTGCLAAMAADEFGEPLIFLGVVISVILLVGTAYALEAARGKRVGITSEVAVLIAVLIGALCYWGFLALATALGIITTVILSIKVETDRFVRTLTREDIITALQFAVISVIVLPVLPNESLGPAPFDVLNPFQIWLMVVFITGISFAGYVLIKFVGAERGIELTGLIGGFVSSTAVTLSFSERSKTGQRLQKPLALAIIAAWTILFPRVMVQVGVINPDLLGVIWPPLLAAGLAGLLYAAYMFFSRDKIEDSDIEFANPFSLISALRFGLIYAVILLVARASQLYFGDTGLLVSSFFSGFADVNAISISVAQLSRAGTLGLRVAGQAVVVAVMANTLVKGGIVFAIGSASLRKAIWPGMVLIVAVGLTTAFLL